MTWGFDWWWCELVGWVLGGCGGVSDIHGGERVVTRWVLVVFIFSIIQLITCPFFTNFCFRNFVEECATKLI